MNYIFLASAIVVYLTIGLVLAKLDARERQEPLDVSMIFLWFIGFDIRVKYWFVLRSIKRRGEQQLAEVERERDGEFHVLSLQRENGVATIVVSLYGEVSTWRGSDLTWYCVETGEMSAIWLANRLRLENDFRGKTSSPGA